MKDALRLTVLVAVFWFSVYGIFLRGAPIALADLATSTNFQLQQVITSGGAHSTSTHFQGVGSLGQPAVGISSSTSFILKGGFLYFKPVASVATSGGGGSSDGGGSVSPSSGSGGGGGGIGYLFGEILKGIFPPQNLSCNIDFNEDGLVNIVDLSIILYYYGNTGISLGCSDLNSNNVVDFPDISILMYYWTG